MPSSGNAPKRERVRADAHSGFRLRGNRVACSSWGTLNSRNEQGRPSFRVHDKFMNPRVERFRSTRDLRTRRHNVTSSSPSTVCMVLSCADINGRRPKTMTRSSKKTRITRATVLSHSGLELWLTFAAIIVISIATLAASDRDDDDRDRVGIY